MAREPDADSRPISVAELMARARELDGSAAPGDGGTSVRRAASNDSDAAPPTDENAESDGSGRRRRGGAGSVSFAELTGELPRLSDTPSHPGRQSPEPPSADTAESRFVPNESTPRAPSTPETRASSTSSPRPFPRSEPPIPSREPQSFPRSEVPIGRPPEPRPPTAPWSSPDRPGRRAPDRPAAPPPTRDISSGAIQDRFRAQRPPVGDDAVETGIIPRIEAEPAAEPSAPTTGSLDSTHLSHLSPQERERDFERYRNFEDIDDQPEPEPEAKKRRGLFGGLRRGRATPPVDDHADPRDDDRETGPSDHQPREQPWTRWPADDSVQSDPTELRDQLRDSGDFDFADDVDRDHKPAELFPRDTAATEAVGVPGGRRRRDEEAETQVVDLDRAQLGAYADPTPDRRETRPDEDTRTAPGADDSPDDDSPRRRRRALKAAALSGAADRTDAQDTEHSPARQWAMLGIQVVVGLLVGVGLFLGFHELWKWNVYFALVLAVVVIFGMVTTVHVVRRSQDLISTLLALGVGLIVTIGPLVLLASGS